MAKYLEENLGQKLKEIEIEAEDNISRPRVKQIIKDICEMDYFLTRIPSSLIPIFEPSKQLSQNLKRQKLIEKELKRSLFDHRINEDLCQYIISYLSFEEKIKFECVSKQWQRLIYKQQNTLIINDIPTFDSNRLKLIKGSTIKGFIIPINDLENVLKKAKFINKIVIDFVDSSDANREEVLKLISKCCLYLKSIKFDFNGITDSTIETFAKSLSKTLTEIEIKLNNNNNLDKLYASCPLLKSINNFSINSFNGFNKEVANKLKNLSLIFRPGDGPKLTSISKLLNNSVEKLSISCSQSLKDSVVVEMIRQLSEFVNCETLSICLNKIQGKHELKTIINEFKNLSNKATKIKRLKLSFERIDYKFSIDLLESMKHFKKLQKLEFDVFEVEDDIEENSVNVLSIESLQGLPLTHLSLSHLLINDKVFDEMSRFIPNLKVLSLYVIDITDKAFKSISKLKKLSKITINSPNDTMNDITDSRVMAFIENCPQINSIRFEVRPNMTDETIDTLKALRKPRIQFNHLLSDIKE